IQDRRGTFYFVQTIEQMNPQVFAWLDLLDTNVWVILILMTIVASFTMISGLLIIILERTNMIGVLKAMGCNNSQLQKIFLYVSCFLIGKGLLIGNVIGIGICLLQKHFHLIALDPDSYYLEWVPIALDAKAIIILNIGTIAIALHVMMIPSSLVARISPVKAIQSE
ncbi:MAG: FtsX-like permease family protein, partial [Bacteroidales bacterium]|nr:FtsX-like permease family protein [Bacteroidales bacterium]